MGFIKEFKEFAMRGNVVDMAVGIVIGGAFGKIVTSLVEKIIMPPIGYLTSGTDFTKMAYTLKEATEDQEAIVIGYGDLLNTILNFVIIAFAIFIVIKLMNAAQSAWDDKEEEKPSEPSAEVKLLTEIRDSLAKQ